jgi:hypothetical protein
VKVTDFTFVSLVTAAVLAGCTNAPEEETASLDQWLGDTTHFAVSGKFDGMEFNYRTEGEAAVAAHVNCTRHYTPFPGAVPNAQGKYDPSQMYFVMKDTVGIFEINGKLTSLGMGYWWNDPEPGTTLEVIPRITGKSIPTTNAWVDFQIEDYPKEGPPTKPVRSAEGGTVSIKAKSGSPEPGSAYVTSGGRTGFFASINWGPQEYLKVSATADCVDSLYALWARSLIIPPPR